MPTIEEMRAALKAEKTSPSVEEMRAALKKDLTAAQPQEPSSGIEKFGEYGLQAVKTVGELVDRLGYAQARNLMSYVMDQSQFKQPSVSVGDIITGSNAPSAAQLIKRAGVPDVNFNLQSNAENIQGFKTTPQVSSQEQQQLKQTEATIPTSELLGAASDFYLGSKIPAKTVPAIGKAASIAKEESKALSPVIDKAANILTNFTAKAGETLTGLPQQNIKQYITKNKEINDIIAKNGGDMTQAADELRAGLQSAIRSRVMGLNNDIKKIVLSSDNISAPKEKIVDALDRVKGGINPELYPDSIAEIDQMISKVNKLADESGNISAKNINEIKGFFQEAASSTYLKGGQLFSRSSQAQSAAKQAAREARKLEVGAMPGTGPINLELSKIHTIEKNINPNLITPEKSDAALMAAGSGQNLRNIKNLQRIGQAAGIDALEAAQKLSTAQQFAKPAWIPIDSTGKSFARLAIGSAVGAAAFGPFGTPLGMALSSPAALKAAINAGQVSKKVFSTLTGGSSQATEQAFEKAIEFVSTKQGQQAIGALLASENRMSQSGAKALQNAGFDPVIIEQLQARPDGKKILEDASGVSPDSRAMEAIKKKIESLKLPRQKSSSAYPLIMRKDGLQATVFSDRDYKEAKSEGWA